MPRRSPLSELVVDALAAHRLVRLLQRDTLLARPRMALIERWQDHPAAELLVCHWCAGVHVAALTRLARHLAPRVWAPIAATLAAASVASLVADVEDR